MVRRLLKVLVQPVFVDDVDGELVEVAAPTTVVPARKVEDLPAELFAQLAAYNAAQVEAVEAG